MKSQIALAMTAPIFILCLLGCDPGTPLGDLVHKSKTRNGQVVVVNSGANPVTVSLRGFEQSGDGACSPYIVDITNEVVGAGENRKILREVSCSRNNLFKWNAEVSAQNGFSAKFSGIASDFDVRVSCDISSCSATAHCDGGSCD